MDTSELLVSQSVVERFVAFIGRVITGFFDLLFGTGQVLFTIVGVPIRVTDFAIMVMFAGVVIFYFTIHERLADAKKTIADKIDAQYLKPTIHKQKNTRWTRIQLLMQSSNPSDWKLAIIECDIMLDELLFTLGYYGNTIADKLKLIHKSDFPALQNAWDAHMIRNRIAHEGSGFELNQRDALQTFYLYEHVFKDAHYI